MKHPRNSENAPDEAGLAAAAQGGDEAEFGRLAEEFRPQLARACRRRLGDADEAEDAVQETLVRAWRALPRLREPERFGPWLHRIAANVCRDRLAARQSLEPLAEAAGVGAEATPEGALLSRAVQEAVASLPSDLQVAMSLYHLEGLSFSEIASRLGLPATTVKGRLNRGRSLLREEMLRMGTITEGEKVEFAPSRLALLLAPGTAYGAGGEDARELGRQLNSAGFAVSEVRPERAMASLSRAIPQLLVLADDAAGIDAFALIRDLRAEHRTRGIAVILLLRPDGSGDDRLHRAWQAGVDCLLTLPCDPNELVEFARRIDRQARAQQCMIIATDLAWRGEATSCLRYLSAAIELGGEEKRVEARRSAAFRRLARNAEFRELVGSMEEQSPPVQVALVGMPVVCFDKEANLQAMEQVLREHAGRGVDLFLFPERCISGEAPRGTPKDDPATYARIAEPVPDGPSTRRVIEMAREHRTTICAGVWEESEGRFYSTSFLCGPEGYIGKQRRLLLNPKYAGVLSAGEGLSALPLFGHRCALLASADWLFPEPSCLTGLAETALILAPTDCYDASQEVWLKSAALARALDTYAPVLVACGGDASRVRQERVMAGLMADPACEPPQVLLCRTRARGETKVLFVQVALQRPRQVWLAAREGALLGHLQGHVLRVAQPDAVATSRPRPG